MLLGFSWGGPPDAGNSAPRLTGQPDWSMASYDGSSNTVAAAVRNSTSDLACHAPDVGRREPFALLGHHTFDSAHIAFDVVTSPGTVREVLKQRVQGGSGNAL